MFEECKHLVLKNASDTKLNGSIGSEDEGSIKHVVNVYLGSAEASAVIQQIITQLANQPQDIRESIIHLSSVPEPTRSHLLQAGRSYCSVIKRNVQQALFDSRDCDARNSINTVNSQSSIDNDSVFSHEASRHFSAGSSTTQYSGLLDLDPLAGPSTLPGQANGHQTLEETVIPPHSPLSGQNPTGKQCLAESLPSSAKPEIRGPLAEERKAKSLNKVFWCPEPHCDKGFGRKDTLKNHMEDLHMTLTCSLCPKEMSRRGSRQQMEIHVKEQHRYDAEARVLVKDRLYFGCPSCTRCLDGFDEYYTHTNTEHTQLNIPPKKWEWTRLWSLLGHDERIISAIENQAKEENLDWRSKLSKLPAERQEILVKELEKGYPYLHSEGPEIFASDFLNCLRPAPVSGMDWSD